MGFVDIRERLFEFALHVIGGYERKPDAGEGVDVCPDEDILTAFVENRLGDADRKKTEQHLAACPACRRLVGERIRIEGGERDRRTVLPFPVPARRVLAVAAALFFCVGVYIVMQKADILPWGGDRYVALVTEEEAALPVSKGFIFETDAGPEIMIVSPKEGEALVVPFRMEIDFLPGADNSPPDMGTLKVYYRRGEMIDITDRFAAHLEDNSIVINKATMPVGEHVLVIEISDGEGNRTVKSLKLIVTDE